MQTLLAAMSDSSQLMFFKNPLVQRGLMREWGKVVNLERPGTRGQANCYRLWGQLTGLQRSRCGSRGIASAIKYPRGTTSSTSNPMRWQQRGGNGAGCPIPSQSDPAQQGAAPTLSPSSPGGPTGPAGPGSPTGPWMPSRPAGP